MNVLTLKTLIALTAEVCLLRHSSVSFQVNAAPANDYNADLAQLMRLIITSVSKKAQSLLNTSQLQYTSELTTPPTKIDRGVYGKITWNF